MLTSDNTAKVQGLSSLIGNTPLLEIKFEFNGETRSIYAKAENLNMTGSIKDRMAFHIIKQGYARKKLMPGALIIEATRVIQELHSLQSAEPWDIRLLSSCLIG